ncbi:MAG: toll/interleukin-1 receptor domain-containing protein [Candidatus Eremiobacteraeota bacterium]|nr:toll/interleukin-1 receptor domain-containing protein [Candidatus Eremiobacteraeota bacterium]
MPTVFFSYSHADEPLRDQLEKHLSALKRGGLVDTWHDRKIVAGDALDATVMQQLETADVVLLLVSADFIASDYCVGREMARALERHADGSCVVIPVILRACDWKATQLKDLLATPRDGRPVMQWPDRDEAFLDVAQAVRTAVERLGRTPAAPAPAVAHALPASITTTASGPRSSNLRIAKEFSDRDRDVFVLETYDYVARYFENSLGELRARNSDLETDFRRIDAERFTAVVYRGGAAATKCTVFLSRIFGSQSIGYSADDSGRTNAYNEQLTAASDDQSLFFTTMTARSEHAHLSTAGAAEHLWSTFVAPLQ